MRIALDARTVYAVNRRGTGKNLIDLYSQVARKKPDWQFVMLHRDEHEFVPFDDICNITQKTGEIVGDRWNMWLNVRLPMLAKACGADMLHCPANVSPLLNTVPVILTVHDLIPMDCPDREYAQWWRKNVARGIERAGLVLTPSEFSKVQILNEFGDFADKIVVNHWAPDTGCAFTEDIEIVRAVREKYAIPSGKRFFMTFGARDGRKNTRRVMEAWKTLPDELKDEYCLLVVGLNDLAMREFSAVRDELAIGGSCVLHGFAQEQDIPALLSAADVMCYVSLYEGFGLPVLDAFTCRAAVLTSNTTSLPEVAGDAAVLVDPEDTQAIAEAMRTLMTSETLRNELVQKGLSRVKEFTWDRCVDRYIRAVETRMIEKT